MMMLTLISAFFQVLIQHIIEYIILNNFQILTLVIYIVFIGSILSGAYFGDKMSPLCQQERSQILNKEKALNMLKSKLYQLEVDKVNKEKDERDSTKLKIDFGSQIRNYVLHPYKMIKDVRTGIERGDVNNVLDGDINGFIKAFLLQSENKN